MTTETVAQEIEPCPFCGSVVETYQQTSKVPDNWAVRCEVCGAQCGPSASTTAARYNWNLRTHDARAHAHAREVEALRSDLSDYMQAANAEAARSDMLATKVEALQLALDNERVRGVHTCSIYCDRPLCVARREIESLRQRAEAAEAALNIAHSHIDMGALHVSHYKDAAAIDAAIGARVG